MTDGHAISKLNRSQKMRKMGIFPEGISIVTCGGLCIFSCLLKFLNHQKPAENGSNKKRKFQFVVQAKTPTLDPKNKS